MPTARLARTQPSAALRAVHDERAILARALATRWPAAARDVLLIAAKVDRFNRHAVGFGVAPLAADPPLSVASAMWAALDGRPR